MFLIEKTVALLLAPLGVGLLLGVLALAAASMRWRKVGFVLGSVAVAWVYVWSTPWVSGRP